MHEFLGTQIAATMKRVLKFFLSKFYKGKYFININFFQPKSKSIKQMPIKSVKWNSAHFTDEETGAQRDK